MVSCTFGVYFAAPLKPFVAPLHCMILHSNATDGFNVDLFFSVPWFFNAEAMCYTPRLTPFVKMMHTSARVL